MITAATDDDTQRLSSAEFGLASCSLRGRQWHGGAKLCVALAKRRLLAVSL